MADSKVTDLSAQTSHDGDDEIYLYDTSGSADKKSALKNILAQDEAMVVNSALYFAETALSDGANISWDVQAIPVASITLGGNRTLDNPTNLKAGATYILRAIQDGTGSRTLAYGALYLWPGGSAPALSTGAADVDLLVFYCDGTSLYGNITKDYS